MGNIKNVIWQATSNNTGVATWDAGGIPQPMTLQLTSTVTRIVIADAIRTNNTIDARKRTFVASYSERLLTAELNPETSQKVDACIDAIIAGIWKELNQ
jgi:hypothetical protein